MLKKTDLFTDFSFLPHKKPKGKQNKQSEIKSSKARIRKNHFFWLEEAYNTARGETSLWVAVITQAVVDSISKCNKKEAKYHKHEAINWLTGNSKDFNDVCIRAGMEPEYVRKKAKQIIASPTQWRAEAGKGKRYQERKKYREKKHTEKKNTSGKNTTSIVISLS